MSNLSDLLPAGAGGKQVNFVASGTLASGQTVALKTDGTVEAVSGVTEGVGAESVFATVISNYNAAAYDSTNNKVVICYQDNNNSGYGMAVIGTVSGTSISFGTAVIFESASSNYISPVYDSTNNKIIIAYQREVSGVFKGMSIVGTVSGTSISFGTAVIFESATSRFVSAAFDSTANKIIINYRDDGNSSYGTAIVGTVSGTSITFGTAVVYNSGECERQNTVYDSNANKTVILYTDTSNSYQGTAIIGTVSGTSISFGTEVVFNAAVTNWISATYDSSSSKVVIAYQDQGNSQYGTAIIGTVSGTSISFGAATVFESAGTEYVSATFDSSANKVVIAYRDSPNTDRGTAIVGTVSGTSISFGSAVVYNSGVTSYVTATFDSTANKVVIAYRDQGNSNYGTGIVFTVGSTNNTSFIGITDAAISSAASGSVTIKGGISSNVSSLTPNATYYVQTDGTLTTTSSSVLAGKALSSTSINLDYTT